MTFAAINGGRTMEGWLFKRGAGSYPTVLILQPYQMLEFTNMRLPNMQPRVSYVHRRWFVRADGLSMSDGI